MISIDNITKLPTVKLEYFSAKRPELLPFHATTVNVLWNFISFGLWIIDEFFEYFGEVEWAIYFDIC
jgi:hypothetical protein